MAIRKRIQRPQREMGVENPEFGAMLCSVSGSVSPSVKRLLFICSGNFYRSRLAEALFRHYTDSEEMEWEVFSRGLAVTGALSGVSPEVIDFLKPMGLLEAVDDRDPLPLLVDELIGASHVVLLNQAEHEPTMEREFRPLYLKLLGAGSITFWNVFDLPAERTSWGKTACPSQPASSAVEHIHFAVKDLVARLDELPLQRS